MDRKTEEELIAKFDRLEEIWLALKQIEAEVRRIRNQDPTAAAVPRSDVH